MFDPDKTSMIETKVSKEAHRHMDADINMCRDVGLTQADKALASIGELMKKGAHTEEGFLVGAAVMGYPCVMNGGAFAAYTLLYTLVQRGMIEERIIDEVMTPLFHTLHDQSKARAKKGVLDDADDLQAHIDEIDEALGAAGSMKEAFKAIFGS